MRHTVFHHLFMVVYSEIINFVWLFTGVLLFISDWVIIKFTLEAFFRVAVGLPLLMIGISMIFLKTGEIFVVIIRPKRLKAICIFCNEPFSKPDEEGR